MFGSNQLSANLARAPSGPQATASWWTCATLSPRLLLQHPPLRPPHRQCPKRRWLQWRLDMSLGSNCSNHPKKNQNGQIWSIYHGNLAVLHLSWGYIDYRTLALAIGGGDSSAQRSQDSDVLHVWMHATWRRFFFIQDWDPKRYEKMAIYSGFSH